MEELEQMIELQLDNYIDIYIREGRNDSDGVYIMHWLSAVPVRIIHSKIQRKREKIAVSSLSVDNSKETRWP